MTPAITVIIDKGLVEAMPATLKTAVVTPTLKKPHSGPEVLKDYRPISNLACISKVTQKIAAECLISHLQDNNLHEAMQSAYRKYTVVKRLPYSQFRNIFSEASTDAKVLCYYSPPPRCRV